MKDFLQNQGNQNIYGSRDAIQEAFKIDLIVDGDAWMRMFKDRDKTIHTYNRQTADEISNAINKIYFELFKKLEHTFDSLIST